MQSSNILLASLLTIYSRTFTREINKSRFINGKAYLRIVNLSNTVICK
jgi:hypothetical protein